MAFALHKRLKTLKSRNIKTLRTVYTISKIKSTPYPAFRMYYNIYYIMSNTKTMLYLNQEINVYKIWLV